MSSKKLLLIAGLVWMIAGINVAIIGLSSFASGTFSVFILLLTLAVFLLFHIGVFQKTARKNTERITGLSPDQMRWWKFLDRKGFIIMAVMMTGGIGLRMSGVLPAAFISFFYSGLGAALFIAGVTYVIACFRTSFSCPFKSGRGEA